MLLLFTHSLVAFVLNNTVFWPFYTPYFSNIALLFAVLINTCKLTGKRRMLAQQKMIIGYVHLFLSVCIQKTIIFNYTFIQWIYIYADVFFRILAFTFLLRFRRYSTIFMLIMTQISFFLYRSYSSIYVVVFKINLV